MITVNCACGTQRIYAPEDGASLAEYLTKPATFEAGTVVKIPYCSTCGVQNDTPFEIEYYMLETDSTKESKRGEGYMAHRVTSQSDD